MTTSWTLPTNVIQYAENGAESAHISWNYIDNIKDLDNRSAHSNGTLSHIPRSPKIDIRNKTYYIRATGFNFQNIPDTVAGIEVRLNARRYGRATDDTIALCLNEAAIGDNHATLPISPIKIYGSSSDLWGSTNLTLSNIQDPSFGIIFRFQAHPNWPHRDPVLVDSVEMRIH